MSNERTMFKMHRFDPDPVSVLIGSSAFVFVWQAVENSLVQVGFILDLNYIRMKRSSKPFVVSRWEMEEKGSV